MKYKKSQIKFGESIGVIIIVYIIIMVGLIWYNNINSKDLNELHKKDLNARAFERYQFIVNLNLIHTSQKGNIDEDFDLISLKTMHNFTNTKYGKLFFSNQLGYSLIEVDIYNNSVFDNIQTDNYQEKIILYNNTPNRNSQIHSVQTYRTLIPIRDNINKINLIGVIYIKSINLK